LKAVVQRVSSARVLVDESEIGAIGPVTIVLET
jgi:D-Tyr-tRNAtyr deacylase